MTTVHNFFYFKELDLLKKNHKSEKEHLEKRLKDRKSDHEAKIGESFYL